MHYDLSRIREAVQFLVDTPYYAHYTKRLRSLVSRPRAMPYKDDAEVLNELLILGRSNPEALDNLLELAKYKRNGRGDYQRQYMAAQRGRYRKISQLEEVLTGRSLSPDEKKEAITKQYIIWNKDKGEFLSNRAKDHIDEFGEPPDWNARNTYIRAFWEAKDAELDALLSEATKTLSKTVTRKRLVVVKKDNPTVMAEKLRKVLDARRK